VKVVQAVLPYWLDRPPEEALEIARAARDAGIEKLWIGEMATFDAVALATAIGLRTPGLSLEIGPLAIGVRTPVAIALGVASVATLTPSDVGIALGASSPAIVSAWHDRDWAHSAPRMRETVACLRAILAGETSNCDGHYVRSHGFKLRRAVPQVQLTVAAFGPEMTRVAAEHADTVLLNLVPPAHVRAVRERIDAHAAAVSRQPPRLAVWLAAALDPGEAALAQLSAQIAVYLAPPGYGEMFTQLGFGEFVQRARSGALRADLAGEIPLELLESVCALGSRDDLRARISAYRGAGADVVAVVPSTAEDAGGRRVLSAVGE
jgi:probable F420-dependent oxidoreductase